MKYAEGSQTGFFNALVVFFCTRCYHNAGLKNERDDRVPNTRAAQVEFKKEQDIIVIYTYEYIIRVSIKYIVHFRARVYTLPINPFVIDDVFYPLIFQRLYQRGRGRRYGTGLHIMHYMPGKYDKWLYNKLHPLSNWPRKRFDVYFSSIPTYILRILK